MKLFEDKEDYEDFIDFVVGTAWVCVAVFVASGVAIMAMLALGW
jgi:hypothetical protein